MRWNIFRALCIVQVVIAGLQAGISFVSMAFTPDLFNVLDTLCFTAMVLFASLGLTLVNRNYPDDPPQGAQKRYFNWLYIVNFLGLAYLLAYVYVRLKFFFLASLFLLETRGLALVLVMHFINLTMLFLQVYLLYMMFRMRRELYANFMRSIESLGENS